MRLLAIALVVMGIAACASVEKDIVTPDSVVATATPVASDSKKICRQLKVIGTNYPRRQCLTAAEWGEYEKEGREQVETFERDIQNGGTNLPVGE
jgi:hypothetical protein